MKKLKKLTKMSLAVSIFLFFLIAVNVLAAGPSGQDDAFPEREVRLLVGFGAGGGTDLQARIFAAEMEKYLGVPIVIQNQPGASSAIASTTILNSTADGYLMYAIAEPTCAVTIVAQDVSYTVDDFVAIGGYNKDPGVLVVRMDSPFNNIEDVINESKNRTITIGTTGLYGVHAFASKRMAEALGIENYELISYESGAEQDAALFGGHVDMTGRTGGYYLKHNDTVRILAIATEERYPGLEDVPTVLELSGNDVRVMAVRGIAVHKDTPADRVEVLRKAFLAAGEAEDKLRKQFLNAGFGFFITPPEEYDEVRRALFQDVLDNKELFVAE